MKRRNTGHEIQMFGIHLIVASVAFAVVLALGVGAAFLVRWALPLELASSSPQKALEASGRILELHERFWPVVLVSLVGVALAAGWLGRRITGPLVRFVDAFRQIAEGELPPPIQIRATDYLVNEAHELNVMVAALRDRAKEIRESLEELREHAAKSEDEALATLAERALGKLKALDGSPS